MILTPSQAESTRASKQRQKRFCEKPYFWIIIFCEYPSAPHRPPQFNTSVPHKDQTFSAPKILQFHTKNPQFHTKNPSVPPPSVPHQKSLSSTQLPQFHPKNPSVPLQKPLSSTHLPQFNTPSSVQHQKPLSSTPKKL